MRIRWSVKFFAYRRGGGGQKGVSIRMRFTLRGETPVDFSTGFILPESGWDAARQMAVGGTPDADEANRTINIWRATISEVMSRYEIIEKRVPSRGEVKDLFNDIVGRDTPLKRSLDEYENMEFFPCFDLFTSTMGKKNQWTKGTFDKFAAIRSHLHAYDPLLSFHNLSERKMQGYVDYLTDYGMRNTTIAKNLAFVRWFLRWARDTGHYTGNLHNTFKPRLKGVSGDGEIIYLTGDELRRLQEHEFAPSQAALERVRDVFIFCCFTGLRYSDAAKLRRTDIKRGVIEVVTKKTADALKIELNKHSKAVLDKYSSAVFPDGLALPVISNEKMNAHLKDLGKLCDIDEPTRRVYFRGNRRFEEVFPKWMLLSTHVARRTFVVTALQLGIPSEVIMRWTGHSSFEAMKPYVAIVDELKRKSMSRFDNF